MADLKEKLWNFSRAIGDSGDEEDIQAHSIPMVPDKIRKSNEAAYRPKLVAVGPVHRGRAELLFMEEPKRRCMLSLLSRFTDDVPEGAQAIRGHFPSAVHANYECEIKLHVGALNEIMSVDCNFILELLISNSEKMRERFPLKRSMTDSGPGAILGKDEMVLSDLLVLENQVPFSILRTYWCSLLSHPDPENGENIEIEFVKSALSLFGYTNDRLGATNSSVSNLLQLVHSSITWNGAIEEGKSIEIKKADEELKRCATKIRARGVKIRTPRDKLDKRSSILVRNKTFQTLIRLLKKLMNIKTENAQDSDLEGGPSEMEPLKSSKSKTFDIGIQFDKGTGILEIPPLHITETTEAIWRNFIAWEQCNARWWIMFDHKNKNMAANCTFTSYALFFSGLTCCVHDIQLLKDRKVIVLDDTDKSNRDLLTLFHTIAEGVDYMDSRFSGCSDELDKYSKADPLTKWTLIMWHRFRRILTNMLQAISTGKYLISFAVVSSVLALLLTIAQTVLAVLSLK